MRRFAGSLVCLIAILSAQASPDEVAFAPVQRGFDAAGERVLPYAPDRLLIKLTEPALERSMLTVAVRRGLASGGPETGIDSVDSISREAGVTGIDRSTIEVADAALDRDLGVSRWFVFRVPAGVEVSALVARYAADPAVEAATPDWRAFPAAVPNDPLYPDQWGHDNTGQMKDYCWGCGGHDNGTPVGTPGFDANAETAWDASQGYGSAAVVIAILDSGVDANHPDLRQVAGWDYGSGDSNPDDDSAQPGHGTACAGVAAAISENNLGPAGIAGGASIMPLKIANNSGDIFFSAVQNALYHAADNGADVASMSFGAAIGSDPATDDAIVYAYHAGVTLLAATGNENASTISYPAVHSLVIGIGAASPCDGRKRSSSSSAEVNPGVSTDPNGYTCDGERWWGSNYGTNSADAAGAVDVLAPTILPTTDIGGSGGYAAGDYYLWFNGTSAATPYAAGVAGLIVSANPSFTPDQVRQALVTTATDVVNVESGTGWDRYSGYGLVDAAAAVGGGGPPPTQSYATLPYSTGFESGALDAYWTTASTSDGRVRVLNTNGPRSGAWHLTMDDPTSGGFAQNEAWLHLDLAGESDVDLDFWWKEFGDETHAQDGVYFSDDGGASFVKVQDLNGQSYTNNTWQSFALDLDQLAAANGLSLSATFVVKLQQYDNYPIATDGFAFDDISVTAVAAPPRTVTVTAPNGGETLTAGSVTTITWTSTGSITNVAIDYSTDGGASWTPITGSTANDGAYGWTVPSEATSQGRVRVADAADAAVNDVSDGNFTIDVPPSGNYATLPYSTGFESGALDGFWTTASTADGRVRVLSSNGPHGGSWHLTMDDPTSGGYAQNEAWLHLDLSGESDVDLGFWWKEFGDETHAQDGVYFSDNGGASFVKVQDLNGQSYTNNTWQQFTLDVDALAAANGLALSATFVVKFQQYDNYPIATDGFAFDDISVTAVAAPGGDYAPLPYSTGFESGALDVYWTTASTADGRVRVLSTNGPHRGSYLLALDDPTSGGYAQNEAWLRLDLAGESNVGLTFWWKEFGDETHAQDGVYFSDDGGAGFVKVQDLNGQSYANDTWQFFSLDVDQLAAANGLALSATFVVKFQQYDNYPIATDGFAFDDVDVHRGSITGESEPNGGASSADGPLGNGVAVSGSIASSTDDDWFWFDVATAGNVDIILDILGAADLDWYLYHESDTVNWVARGYTTSDPETGSYNCAVARYYLMVDGYQGATSGYTLTLQGAGISTLGAGPSSAGGAGAAVFEPSNDP